MIRVALLKNHPQAIPTLANIWHEILGKIWVPDIPVERVITRFQDHLNDQDQRLGWEKIGMDEFKSHPVTVMEIDL